MFNFLKVNRDSDIESTMESFVPAAGWNELRKRYPPRIDRKRGLRSLSQAMEMENPENLQCTSSAPRWEISPMDCVSESEILQVEEGLVLERAVAEFDACFASAPFLDDLDWALQTYEICERSSSESDLMDEELELLEEVQDLTRFVARTTPRRSQVASSQVASSSPSIPD